MILPIEQKLSTVGMRRSIAQVVYPIVRCVCPLHRVKPILKQINRNIVITMCIGKTCFPLTKFIELLGSSLYGWSQTKPTFDAVRAVTGKRSLVLPRSTFVGSGQWSGHWLGDNEATWHEMKRSLIGMVEFNWFGIPLNGADICGFDKTPTEEMCVRWMQVGAFYPFSRNVSTFPSSASFVYTTLV